MITIETIYDELDRPYVCECEGTRVLRVISGPKFEDEVESEASKLCDAGYMNDVRFGEY